MTNAMPTIAITGASGFLGAKLQEYFISRGWKVVSLVRNAKGKTSAHPQLTYRQYDMEKIPEKTMLAGCDFVVHAAYIKLSPQHPDAHQLNVNAAKALIDIINQSKVSQSLFISTMSAHEGAISVYGKQKLEIEQLFLETNVSTVFRCGLIIGNGGIVREMASFMKSKHAVPLIGGGNQPLQIIGVSDLSQAIENAFIKKQTGLFIVANPTVYSYREFYKELAKSLGTPVVYIPLPYWLLQAVFKTAAIMRIPLGVGEDNLKGLKKLTAMPSKKDMRTLGVDPVNLPTALRHTDLQ